MKTFILPAGREELRNLLNSLPKDKRWEVTVEEYQPKRSGMANSYYWKCIVTPLAEFAGYGRTEAHNLLLGEYFGWKTVEFNGKQVTMPARRTTEPDILRTPEFMGYLEHCKSVLANLGVPVQEEVA